MLMLDDVRVAILRVYSRCFVKRYPKAGVR